MLKNSAYFVEFKRIFFPWIYGKNSSARELRMREEKTKKGGARAS